MHQKKLSVVVVEDHLVTLAGLASQLSSAGLEVIGQATNLARGLELVRECPPDALVLDLHLPDSKGPKSLIASFRAFFRGPIVIFSGEDREPFMEALIESGATACIHKSKSAEYVAQRISQLVGGEGAVEARPSRHKITSAEREILMLLARGLRYEDIASRRGTTAETARKQCDRLQVKLELGSREQLIAWAVQQGYGRIEL